MIRITDANGRPHLLAPSAISSITGATEAARWIGIHSYVRTSDGRIIEAKETLDEIRAAMLTARKEPQQ